VTLKRILYAEDEPLIQAVAKLALEKVGGFDVLICSSGSEALEKIVSFAPDLVLLDVVMPGMTGPATLQRLRQDPTTADIPVVFLTANALPSEVAHYKGLGAMDVVAKPFNPMTLAAQIKLIWDKHEC
jgi:two-component system OmpR family response regulator